MTNQIIIYSFVIILLHQELNIGYYLRKWTGQRISKPIKVLDCLPCFSFWVTLIGTLLTTQNYLLPMVVFLIFKIYDSIKAGF
jgi:hypothetical protein